MRAVVHDRFGPPEVLRVGDVERPAPKEDEVLVRVHASTVTRGDAMGVRSAEYRFTRLFTGIRRPRRTIAGSEFAGRVEEVGAAVTEFRAGDEVFGIEGGANAEYVTVRQSGVIAQKPTGLTFDEAAAVPDGSLLALTCLRPAYPLRRQSVLVYVPLVALVTRFVGSRRAKLGIGRYRREDLVLVKELVDTGKYRPVIDRRYALDEVVEATRYVETGQKTGNVVLRVSEAAAGEQPEPAAKHEEEVPA